MRCYKCNSVLSDTDFCNSCGADVTLYKKIVRMSNTYYNMGLAKARVRDLSGAADLLRRSELTYNDLAPIDKKRKELPRSVAEEAEIQIKYEGYIKLQQEQIDEFKQLEGKKLSADIDYNDIKGLCLEARQKLNKQKPLSVGQASRISGVSPADISVLLIYLSQNKK